MHRGEIWLINLDLTIGAEIQKTRPAVIINEDAVGVLPLRVIVPLTDWKERYAIAAWMVQITPDRRNGLINPSAADAFQIRSVSIARFAAQVGVISEGDLSRILQAVKVVVGF